MNPRLRITLVVLVLLLAFYIVTLGWRAVLLIGEGSAIGISLGVALLVIGAVGAWAVIREIRFGMATGALARRLADEGGLPVDDLPRLPSGRVDRAAADEAFARYRGEVDAQPEQWRAWFRLSLAYDVAGDRTRARASARHAVRLARDVAH